MINTGRYPVKLGNGTLLSVKEGNMIREGTRGAEGKHKGNERKELDQQRRRCRKCEDISQGEHKRKKYARGGILSKGTMQEKGAVFGIHI